MNRLKELRALRGLSLRQLEEATGIDNSALSSIENGRRKMGLNIATILADYFGVSIDFMLGRTVSSMVDEFMTNLLKVYKPHEGLPDEDARTAALAFIMKSIYEMNDSLLEEAKNYIAYLNAKKDFKDGE